MSSISPLRTGVALALTVAVMYLACLILILLAPGVVYAVFSTWVHGLNLEPLTANPPTVDLGRGALGLLLISGYSFITGAIYGYARDWLAQR